MVKSRVSIVFWMLAADQVYAYVDPGTTGMLSQLLYLLFYGMLGVLACSFRYLKNLGDLSILVTLRRRLSGFLRKTDRKPT